MVSRLVNLTPRVESSRGRASPHHFVHHVICPPTEVTFLWLVNLKIQVHYHSSDHVCLRPSLLLFAQIQRGQLIHEEKLISARSSQQGRFEQAEVQEDGYSSRGCVDVGY